MYFYRIFKGVEKPFKRMNFERSFLLNNYEKSTVCIRLFNHFPYQIMIRSFTTHDQKHSYVCWMVVQFIAYIRPFGVDGNAKLVFSNFLLPFELWRSQSLARATVSIWNTTIMPVYVCPFFNALRTHTLKN